VIAIEWLWLSRRTSTPGADDGFELFPVAQTVRVVLGSRQGFIERLQYEALLAELPADLKALFVCGYHVGCRRGELRKVQWPQVDFEAGEIKLAGGQTKAKRPRTLRSAATWKSGSGASMRTGMEIDPKYADCIVRRWEEYTGEQAVLDGDGRTFPEVARERLEEAA